MKIVTLKDGEKEKNVNRWRSLLESLTKYDGVKKRVFVIALGGGVIGDLAGFVAASYRRGINYVQVPTTLLAQVDSGVGGKTGVNFLNIKNLIGAFYQPKLVYADVSVLKTLPSVEIKAGLAEIIKYGIIYDRNLFEMLEKNISSIRNLNMNMLEKIVARCYRIKAEIVSKDELDKTGVRAILNFGHTIGHALEGSSQYSYRHGEAVSVGMICAAEISAEMGLSSKQTLCRIEKLLREYGLPVKIKKGKIPEIIKIMNHDKKFVSGKTRFVLPYRIGKVGVREGIDTNLIKRVIKRRMK